MKKKFTVLLLLVLLVASNNPVAAGSKNFLKQLVKAITYAEEASMLLWLTGDTKAEKLIGKQLAWIQSLTTKKESNQEKVARVNRIFNKLAPQYNSHGMGLRCTVLHDSTINAFAIPGGNVYVYSGIVDFLQNDDELAAVIAHELAHVERRHSLKNVRASSALVALLKVAVKNTKDRETWGAVLSALALMKFSRTQEDEADDVGQFKLASAGFDPAAQIAVWERFKSKEGGKSSGLAKYLSSHPSHDQRIENAKKNLAKMNYTPASVTTTSEDNSMVAPPEEPPMLEESAAIAEPTQAARESSEAAVALVPLQVENNDVLNGSFERGYNDENKVDGWDVVEGLFKLSSNVAVDGNYSLEGVANGSFNKARMLSSWICVDENSVFDFSVCIKSENGKQCGAIGIELYDKNKRLRNRIWLKEAMNFPADWNCVNSNLRNTEDSSKIFTYNTAYMRILLQAGPNNNGSIFFDDVKVIRRR